VATHAVHRAGVELAVWDAGEGVPVLLLHGLTATHRYVVMGSTRLERAGHRVISYDARGHGMSSPARDSSGYGYDELALDAVAVLDTLQVPRAVLAGASMGAHTLLRVALEHPDRVGGVVVITPAYEPGESEDPVRLAHWDALAEGLRTGGVEGFLAAYGEPRVPAAWRDTVLTVIRQRLSLVRVALRPRADRRSGRDRSQRRRGRPRAPASRRRGIRERDPRRQADHRRPRTLASCVAGEPALGGDRRGRESGGAVVSAAEERLG
jgi:pimeloyl-ACP methyl ester carboxylesterase